MSRSSAFCNQVLNINICSLAYITTSCVSGEEIIAKTFVDLVEDENPNNCSTKNIQMKQLKPDD